MKSNLKNIITKCNTQFGAPMGRANKGAKPDSGVVFDEEVKLIEGYDAGGVYWGIGNPLRVKFTSDGSYVEFYRESQ